MTIYLFNVRYINILAAKTLLSKINIWCLLWHFLGEAESLKIEKKIIASNANKNRRFLSSNSYLNFNPIANFIEILFFVRRVCFFDPFFKRRYGAHRRQKIIKNLQQRCIVLVKFGKYAAKSFSSHLLPSCAKFIYTAS